MQIIVPFGHVAEVSPVAAAVGKLSVMMTDCQLVAPQHPFKRTSPSAASRNIVGAIAFITFCFFYPLQVLAQECSNIYIVAA
jgi:hypothetical protein